MKYLVSRFLGSETGAVTIDWVILSAGIIGLALASMGVVIDGTQDLTGDVDSNLSNQTATTSF